MDIICWIWTKGLSIQINWNWSKMPSLPSQRVRDKLRAGSDHPARWTHGPRNKHASRNKSGSKQRTQAPIVWQVSSADEHRGIFGLKNVRIKCRLRLINSRTFVLIITNWIDSLRVIYRRIFFDDSINYPVLITKTACSLIIFKISSYILFANFNYLLLVDTFAENPKFIEDILICLREPGSV